MAKKWKKTIKDMQDEYDNLSGEVTKEKDVKEKIRKWANYFDAFTPIVAGGEDEVCDTGETIPE